eukprot:589332-Amphidinium_carterae.1
MSCPRMPIRFNGPLVQELLGSSRGWAGRSPLTVTLSHSHEISAQRLFSLLGHFKKGATKNTATQNSAQSAWFAVILVDVELELQGLFIAIDGGVHEEVVIVLKVVSDLFADVLKLVQVLVYVCLLP